MVLAETLQFGPAFELTQCHGGPRLGRKITPRFGARKCGAAQQMYHPLVLLIRCFTCPPECGRAMGAEDQRDAEIFEVLG